MGNGTAMTSSRLQPMLLFFRQTISSLLQHTVSESLLSMPWGDPITAKRVTICLLWEKVKFKSGFECAPSDINFWAFVVPSGKPTITAAHNTSSTSIQLSWRAPHPSTLHGEFLGYRIAFKPRNAGQDLVQEVLIKDPGISKYTIQRLRIFTQYLVSLQVQNPEGLGPSTTVVVMTDEGGMWSYFYSLKMSCK